MTQQLLIQPPLVQPHVLQQPLAQPHILQQPVVHLDQSTGSVSGLYTVGQNLAMSQNHSVTVLPLATQTGSHLAVGAAQVPLVMPSGSMAVELVGPSSGQLTTASVPLPVAVASGQPSLPPGSCDLQSVGSHDPTSADLSGVHRTMSQSSRLSKKVVKQESPGSESKVSAAALTECRVSMISSPPSQSTAAGAVVISSTPKSRPTLRLPTSSQLGRWQTKPVWFPVFLFMRCGA